MPLQYNLWSFPTEPKSKVLRTFSAIHIDEDVRSLKGSHQNELFHNCTFGELKDLELTHCCLNGSKFTEVDPTKMLGFSVTLDCNSFSGVELSSEIFDLICMLLVKTKGNVEKRQALIKHVVGSQKSREYLTKLSKLE